MAGNYGAPIDLTNSPETTFLQSRHGVRAPGNQVPPFPIQAEQQNLNAALAQLERGEARLREGGLQRARNAEQEVMDAALSLRETLERSREVVRGRLVAREEARRAEDALQKRRDVRHIAVEKARARLSEGGGNQAQERSADLERRLAQHREAILAQERRQEFLKLQRGATAEAQGTPPGELERRRLRVAEDLERRRQLRREGGGQKMPANGVVHEQGAQGLQTGVQGLVDVWGTAGGGQGGLDPVLMRDENHTRGIHRIQEHRQKRPRHNDGGEELDVSPYDHGARAEGHTHTAEANGGGGGAGPSGGGPTGSLTGALAYLAEIFPDVDLTAATEALSLSAAQEGVPRALELLTNAYFEKGYPKRTPPLASKPPEASAGPSKQEVEDVFALGPPPEHCLPAYHKWAVFQLQKDFARVSLTDVRKCLKVHQDRYAPAYRAILTEMQKVHSSNAKGKGVALENPQKGTPDSKVAYWAPNFKLLMKPRPKPRHEPNEECEEFQEELGAVKRAMAKDQEVEDLLLAEKLNEEEYAGEGQEIECGCCYSEYPFEKMVQCAEGHLFCFACLKRRVEESTFGSSSAGGSLPCMDTDGCQAGFPHAEVRRALPEATFTKYEARQAEQALLSAKLANRVRCPFCDFACEVDEGNRVLDCPGCRKASCRECREPSHIPLKCSEVEKKGETAFRVKVEELMTRALVRECSKCKTELIKDAGCNKVTCRCGQTMCYVCRASIKPDYTHFCQHFRQPDSKCNKCTSCNLYTTGNDAEEVKRVRTKAIEEAAHLDPEAAKRMIGAPDDPNDLPKAKRHKHNVPPGHPLAGLVF